MNLKSFQVACSSELSAEEIKLQGIVNGDRRVLKAIYSEYSGLFYSIAKRYANNDQQAEDIVQNAFIQIFKKAYTFKNQGSFEGWMKRVVVNTALATLKKKNLMSNVPLEDLAPSVQTIQPAWLIESMNAEEILKSFALLPKGPRVVLNLYVMDGFNHKEIAKELGISESASRSQLSKARTRLKEILTEKKLIES